MPYNALELATFGKRIKIAQYPKSEQASPEMVSEWLDKADTLFFVDVCAPTHPALFIVWGGLLNHFMRRAQSEASATDSEHLATFFDAAERLEYNALMKTRHSFHDFYGPAEQQAAPICPVYESFSSVTSNLVNEVGQRMLVRILEENRWEPSALLRLLENLKSSQETYVSNTRRSDTKAITLADTALGELLLALQQTWLVSKWRPSKTLGFDAEVYGYLWDMHPYTSWPNNKIENEKTAKLFAATMMAFPEHGLRALAFARKTNWMAEIVMASILPIRFELLETNKSIAVVADLLEFNARLSMRKSFFPEMFAKKHPALHSLLQLYFTMHPPGPDENRAASLNSLAAAWESICTNTPQQGFDHGQASLRSLLEDEEA